MVLVQPQNTRSFINIKTESYTDAFLSTFCSFSILLR
uniref:Uncharacterized protein n=1 Tax=Anguilla anguilla TaxID=7936 RepID=A0A0E9Q2N0_ANGAN